MVRPLVSEPSVIQALSMEGSALSPEPSVISTSSADGSPLVSEPSVIHAQNVDGSALDPEPSMKSTSTVDGSTPGIRTFRDIDLHRGWFNPWYLNHPRFRPSAWTVPL
ncbi:MAG: hypothetical protein MR793_10340 [Bacteroidales bacterium]|nr:hypothetical protein [Bacteroidales bacterium]